jgi:hypothetical protein
MLRTILLASAAIAITPAAAQSFDSAAVSGLGIFAFPADLFDTHEPPKAVQLLAMRTLATQVSRLKLEVDTLAPCMGSPYRGARFRRR